MTGTIIGRVCLNLLLPPRLLAEQVKNWAEALPQRFHRGSLGSQHLREVHACELP